MTLSNTSFRDLFESERDPTFRFLLRLTRNRADAEDLLQESFLTVWRKRDQFEGRGSPGGFLRKTAYRLYLNQRTKDTRRAALAPNNGHVATAPAAATRVEREDSVDFLIGRVKEALGDLPEPLREVFVLFRFEGLTCAQIAETTDSPVKTVETRLRRATLQLAERLKKYKGQLPTR